jgi:hypothetical protein
MVARVRVAVVVVAVVWLVVAVTVVLLPLALVLVLAPLLARACCADTHTFWSDTSSQGVCDEKHARASAPRRSQNLPRPHKRIAPLSTILLSAKRRFQPVPDSTKMSSSSNLASL